MPFQVVLLRRAQADVNAIYDWLEKRSPSGASNWYTAFFDSISSLERDPDVCAAAPEAKRLRLDLRQRLFKTSRGRVYRIIFVLTDKHVRVLRVRGPGQAPLRSRDLR